MSQIIMIVGAIAAAAAAIYDFLSKGVFNG